MKNKIYAALLVLSAISLSIGGYSLYAGRLVPIILTYLTIIAIVIIMALATAMIFYDKRYLKTIGLLMAVISIISSINPSHLSALTKFGNSFYLSVADITMITGFFLFPAIYIILFLMDCLKKGD